MSTQLSHIGGITYLPLASAAALRALIGQRRSQVLSDAYLRVSNKVHAHVQHGLDLYRSLEPIWVQSSSSFNRTQSPQTLHTANYKAHCRSTLYLCCPSVSPSET